MRGKQPWRSNRSSVLRFQATSAESLLWSRLRNRQLGGFKFVRQAAIGDYYVDFVCREQKLILEVDGATHGTDAEIADDAVRTADLQHMGYRIVRVTNADDRDNMAGVLESLLAVLHSEVRAG